MDVIEGFETTDSILETFRKTIGKDFDGYRNHVTRMLNFCYYLKPDLTDEQRQKLQIASAFHDIALWTHDRVDYIDPSVEDCMLYLENNGLSEWCDEIGVMIEMHHYIKPYQGKHQQMTELFRKADLVDFSLGLVKFGIPGHFVKAVKKRIPNAGFHMALMRFTGKQLTRNPLDPMPMMRFKNRYAPKD